METKPKARPMTGRQHAKTGGNSCPFCRGKNVEAAGAIMPDDLDGASLEVECKDCGRAWKDTYKLVGYEAGDEGDDLATATCSLCGNPCDAGKAHLHQGKWIGDECCWDERLKASE